MAVALLTHRKRWIGLSTDIKPTLTAGDDVTIGSTFIETDTKDYSITYDGDNWTKRARNSEADKCSEWQKNKNL